MGPNRTHIFIATARGATLNLRTQSTPTNHHHHKNNYYCNNYNKNYYYYYDDDDYYYYAADDDVHVVSVGIVDDPPLLYK